MKTDKIIVHKTILFLNTLTFSSTQILLFTLLPVLSEKLLLPLSTVIGTFTLGTIFFFLGSPIWCVKSESWGPGRVLSSGLIALGFSFGLVALMLTASKSASGFAPLIVLVISRVIYGAAASAIVPVSQLVRTQMTEETDKVSSLLSHSISLSLGRLLGPALLIVTKGEVVLLFHGLLSWTLVLAILNLVISPTVTKKNQTPREKVNVPYAFLFPLLVAVLFATYTGILHSGLGEILQRTFSLGAKEASLLMAKVLSLGSIVMILTQLAGKFFLKHRVRTLLTAGLFCLSTGALVLQFMNKLSHLWIAIALISIGFAFLWPGQLALVHKVTPNKILARRIGLLSSGNTLGHAIGGIIASLFLGPEIQIIGLVVITLLCICTYVSAQKVFV